MSVTKTEERPVMENDEFYLDVKHKYPDNLIAHTAMAAVALGGVVDRLRLVSEVAKASVEELGQGYRSFDERLVLDAIARLITARYVTERSDGKLTVNRDEIIQQFGEF